MPNAILEMMMLAMSKVFGIAQGHLFTTVPEKVREETKLTSRNRCHADVGAQKDVRDTFTDQERQRSREKS